MGPDEAKAARMGQGTIGDGASGSGSSIVEVGAELGSFSETT